MTENILRNKDTGQAGNPGAFGNHNRTESPITLAGQDPDQVFTLRDGSGHGVFIIVNDQIEPSPERDDSAYTHTAGRIGGFAHTRIRARAIAEMFDQKAATAAVEARAEAGEQMTVLTTGPQGGAIVREVTGTMTASGAALRTKGSRTNGVHLRNINVLASTPGYGNTDQMLAQYTAAANQIPVVNKSTFEDIPEWSGEGKQPSDIAAMYLVDSNDIGQVSTPGCLFAATSFNPETNRFDGYMWAPDGSSATSETKRMASGRLIFSAGRVRNYRAGTHTIFDMISGRLGGTRDEAYGNVNAATK